MQATDAGSRVGEREVCAAPALRSQCRTACGRTTKTLASPTWRIAAAACRASGVVTWAARLQGPGADEPEWLTGRSESQPHIVQSECVPGLIAALEKTPIGAPLGCIAPTCLR